jgi:Kef-type K+ transport system membrane component KefB
MMSDVVVVVLLAAVMTLVRPMIEPGASFSPAELTALGHELVGSVALGTTLGLVLTVYLRTIGTQLVLVLVALGFVASEVMHYLHFDALLSFMVAGFIVQNFSKQGPKFLHAIEQMGSVVYIVFFAIAGAHLDLPLLRVMWPVALGLATARAGITWVAGRISSSLSGDPPTLRKWAWSGLVSQAGLTLGLSSLIERAFPGFGSGFRALAIATVALNEIVGPVLFKFALDRAGETNPPRPSVYPSLRPSAPPRPPA